MAQNAYFKTVAHARKFVDDNIAAQLLKPNHGILITRVVAPHRKFSTLYQQLNPQRLTDFEIRDYFSGASAATDYGNLIDQAEHHRTFGDQSHPMHGAVNGIVHGHAYANMGRLNNLVYITMNGGKDGEWVHMDGPYGYTSIEHATRNVLTAMNIARRLILSTRPEDLIWFIRYDKEKNNWQTTGAFPAPVIRQAVILGRWPFYLPTS